MFNYLFLYILYVLKFVLTGCGTFPYIKNGEKIINRDAAINSTYKTEVSVEYVCNDGFVYSLDNQIVNCTENGFDNKIGKCEKGIKSLKTLLKYLFYPIVCCLYK